MEDSSMMDEDDDLWRTNIQPDVHFVALQRRHPYRISAFILCITYKLYIFWSLQELSGVILHIIHEI